jgi:putative zinc finger protein
MTCPHMEPKLNEYVDGTLAARDRASVEAHLAECAGCRDAVAELRRLVAGARQLPTSITPPRDLWPVIGRRIEQRATWNVQRVWRRRALAAAAVLVIGLGLYRLLPPFTAQYRPAGQGWAAVQADFDRATDELGIILAADRGRLRPETVALLERNLAVIDVAIAESRAALARDPANAELRRLFAAASRQKVELLQWVIRTEES